MSKLWSWMKKRSPNAAALAEARAHVERAEHALRPYSADLQGQHAAQFAAAEKLRLEAQQAEQRGDEDSAGQALRTYEQVVEQLAAVRRGVLADHPELVLRELLARAEELADEIDNKLACCEAWLHVFSGYLASGDGPAAERVSERVFELVEKHADARQAVGLVRQFYSLEKELARAPWIQAARARALAQFHDWDENDPEREGFLLTLLEVQAEWGDLAGARTTLARIEGEFRDEGLRALLIAQARTGDLAGARALATTITDAALQRQAEVDLIAVLAREQPAEALAAARALSDEDARAHALAKLAGAHARAGAHAAALALCAEIEASWQDEAHLEMLEGELANGDLVAAERTLGSLASEELRALGWSRIGEELAHGADPVAAQALALRIPEAFTQASALERLGWTRIRGGDEEAAQSSFRHALEIAGQVARSGPRSATGSVAQSWLLLASRIQVAMGDSTSALTCILGFNDPAQRGAALLGIGQVCGLMGDLSGVEALLDDLSTPLDRSWILDGAVAGLISRAKK